MAYQDNVARPSRSVLEAQVGATRMEYMLQEKGLQAQPDKTNKLVDEDLARNVLMFGKFEVKQKISDKYLGQIIHAGGLEMSALATVEERAGKIKEVTLEIRAIIDEFRMQAMGGLMPVWELWEKALITSLLSGFGTWVWTDFFWRVMLTVTESCRPKLALRCEPRQLGMKWRIRQEKVMLLQKILRHKEDTHCQQIYIQGREMD